MAKPRRRKPAAFYETISLAPGLPRLSRESTITDTPPVYPKIPWKRLASDASALGHDALTYGRRGLGYLTSRPARWLVAMAILGIVTVGTISAVQIGVATMNKYSRDLSNPAIIMNEKNVGTTILDRNGQVLFQGYGAVDRHAIGFDEMPESIKQATLATEDPDFYKHAGFSWRGTARAAYQDIRHTGKVQGGSTITQQLVKNTLLDNEKSFTRKYKEILLSTELERRYSKDQILQMYLNSVYYGQGAYGVEAASETYFHKPAKDLTLEESALLAGIPQSPGIYDPNLNPDAAKGRRDFVLSRMTEHQYISSDTAATAKDQPIVAGTREVTINAPHFVFYVLDQLRQDYGEETVEKGGIVVRTTLDYSKQPQAEQIVKNQVTNLTSHHVTNGGLVSVDPHNGDILNMVGSIDYHQPGFGAVNVMLSQLQPGSSFKPIAYATAFTKGYNGATMVEDKPLKVPDGAGGTYAPTNYDLKFRGPVTLRRALSNSLNIPAVKVLQYATVHDTITMAHNLGIQSPSLDEESRYGLSLVLGGGEVRPIDMAGVYATFANQGRTVTPRSITKVTNKFSEDITKDPPADGKQVLDPRITYMLTNILADTKSRQEEFGANNPLQLSRPAAAKTGTTNDFRDNWTVGYTPDLVTAVWVGNNDHTPMQNVDGITGAAPIWHSYMEMALAGSPVHDFTMPAGMVTAKVCNTDGGLVDNNDPRGVTEVFLAESKPTKRCGWFGGNKPEEKKDDKPKDEQQSAPQPAPATPCDNGGCGGSPTPPSDTPKDRPKDPTGNPGPGGNPRGTNPPG